MFETLFVADIPLAAIVIAAVIVVGLIGATTWLVRRFAAPRLGATTRARQPHLNVIDAVTIDGRRRLVLIRRDNTEHLMMIGGPTDVVIEANIVRAATPRETQARPPAAGDTLPPAERVTRPLQPEPAWPRPIRPEPTPRASEQVVRADLPRRPQQAPRPSPLAQREPGVDDSLGRLSKILGRTAHPDTQASEPSASRRELPPLPALRREPHIPRPQPTPPSPTQSAAPAPVSDAERSSASTQSSSSD